VARVESMIKTYRQQTNSAVLWVSHDPAQLARVADRQLRLEHKQLQVLAA